MTSALFPEMIRPIVTDHRAGRLDAALEQWKLCPPLINHENRQCGLRAAKVVMKARGVLWNAAWGGGSVSGWRPDGSLALVYEVPAAQTSCPCFVGPRLDRLLVTSAWHGYGSAARRSDSGAGHTWVLEGGFEGRADPLFLLADDAATDRGPNT